MEFEDFKKIDQVKASEKENEEKGGINIKHENSLSLFKMSNMANLKRAKVFLTSNTLATKTLSMNFYKPVHTQKNHINQYTLMFSILFPFTLTHSISENPSTSGASPTISKKRARTASWKNSPKPFPCSSTSWTTRPTKTKTALSEWNSSPPEL